MKSLVSCLTLALLLAVPSSGAQTRELAAQEVTVEVPFDFMVRQVMFPAGNYTIKPLQNRTFYLKATLGRESVSVATEPIPSADPHSAGLIFDEHDGHYHLRELWMDSMIGVEVPEPRGEQLRLVRFSGPRAEVLPVSCTTCQ
jgi:hypothetical protein